MSRGTRHTPLRLSADLLDRIDREIEFTNERRAGEPFTRSAWIRQAIEEKLAHSERSRRKGRRKQS
jgi:hypothetical protein